MSIASDIEEAKNLWKTSSWFTKIFIVLTVFLSTSSIASLSDIVFEWKGFILDAIKFYRSWIAEPVRSIAQLLGLKGHSSLEIDALIIFSLSQSVTFRTQSVGKIYTILFVFVYIFAFIAAGLVSNSSNTPDYLFIGSIVILYSVLAVFLYQESTEIFIRGFGPILVAILIVLLLGALNSGLTK